VLVVVNESTLICFRLTDNPYFWRMTVDKKETIERYMEYFGAIPVFVAVVREGGFSAAADALGISKSAVSKRITQLEEQLGVRLLHRTTRKLSLTEAGKRYFEHAAQSLLAAQHAEDAVAELQGEPKGKLRVNAPMSFGRLHVAALMPKFLARYPEITVDLVVDDRVVDIIAAGVDVAIRVGHLPDSSLVARKLAPCRHALCASPDYLSRHGSPASPDDLSQHNCILFSYASRVHEWRLINECGATTVKVSGRYQVNNSEVLLTALRDGTGIGRLPTFVAGPDIKKGNLVELLGSYHFPVDMIYAVVPEREYMPAKTRAFVAFVIEYLGGEQPYWDSYSVGSALVEQV